MHSVQLIMDTIDWERACCRTTRGPVVLRLSVRTSSLSGFLGGLPSFRVL